MLYENAALFQIVLQFLLKHLPTILYKINIQAFTWLAIYSLTSRRRFAVC